MSTLPEDTYRSRIEGCERRLKSQQPVEAALIAAKLLIIAAGIFFLYKIAADANADYILLLGAAILLFAVPAIIHEHFIRKRQFILLVRSQNEMEIRALEYKFVDYSDGSGHVDPEHPFSSDLDLFGPRSVFHFLNRTTTWCGSECLADWMSRHPEEDCHEILKARQAAIRELTDRIELRQDIQAYGRQIKDTLQRPNSFPQLMAEPNLVLKNTVLTLAIHLLPVCTLTAAGLIFAGFHWGIPLGLLVIQSYLNRRTRKSIHRIHLLTSHNAQVFKAYSLIIRQIENAQLRSPLLQDMQTRLQAGGRPASRHIRTLSNLASFFELRRSEILHPVLNSLLLWDLHCVLRLEKWKSCYAEKAPDWLLALGEFEALSSFANLRFNFPNWTFPEIEPEEGIFRAEALGHFLIPPEDRISNDFLVQGRGTILVVTGPNMAGKSTFLKTLGVNLVLGLAGAPVCARSCRLSPFRLYTSMKVSDSLDKHLSLFYAELQRLKKILDVIVRGEDVFYLLDEMLKGTNALDRQAGAMALMRQLVGFQAAGVVATHDLELTRLEEELPEKIKNFHFDGFVEGDQLRFDYILKPGKCESFNALALMRKIGIKI
ncbi:MAG: hypothetical protein WBB73_01715 [Candidatus Aminicenantaceae bacterium]